MTGSALLLRLVAPAIAALLVLATPPAGAQIGGGGLGGSPGGGLGGGIGGGGGFGGLKGPPCPEELEGIPYGEVPCPEPPECPEDGEPTKAKVVHDGNGCRSFIGAPGSEVRTEWILQKEVTDRADGVDDTEFAYTVTVTEGPSSAEVRMVVPLGAGAEVSTD